MNKPLKFFSGVLVVAFIVLFTINPAKYVAVTFEGIKLWAAVILPSLFPYMILTSLLGKLTDIKKFSNKLSPLTRFTFKTSGISLYVLISSMLSGYPIGAKLTAELYSARAIDEKEATKISTFCTTSGPVFILGSVGAMMLNNVSFGLIILIAHYLSAIFTGIIFRNLKGGNKSANAPLKASSLMETVPSAVLSILTVGGYVSICYVFSEMLKDLYLLAPIINSFSFIFNNKNLGEGFTFGIIECTKGAKLIAEAGYSFLTLPLITSLVSFGGLSIIMQCLSFYKKAKINTAVFFLSRIIQAVLSFVFALIFVWIL